jgi:hypothetical protein
MLIYGHFGGVYCFHHQKRSNTGHSACLAYSTTLKTESIRSSETSVNVYQTRRHHIPDDSALHKKMFENLVARDYLVDADQRIILKRTRNCIIVCPVE